MEETCAKTLASAVGMCVEMHVNYTFKFFSGGGCLRPELLTAATVPTAPEDDLLRTKLGVRTWSDQIV